MSTRTNSEACEEEKRLEAARTREKNWQRWGTYLPERQWGTVREDYSADGDSWRSFPYEMAQYRAYRWGEDGLLGWTDRECRLCLSTSFWNGQDDSLKERLFGLSNPEGNHGEDVKELYYYLDATPTHSYAKALYKYPHRAFPYDDLRAENVRRGIAGREYELLDTGALDDDRYFDITVEYAKSDVNDVVIRLTIANRAEVTASLHVLPTLTCRNDWSWSAPGDDYRKPRLSKSTEGFITADVPTLGQYILLPVADTEKHDHQVLFTENETNFARMSPRGDGGGNIYTKDAFDRRVVHGDLNVVNPENEGTKAAFWYELTIAPKSQRVLTFVLAELATQGEGRAGHIDAEALISQRIREADEFYSRIMRSQTTPDEKNISRQAYAGLLWSKQFYFYVERRWSQGDSLQPPPPPGRTRNEDWKHLYCRDVLSVPDKWEYPWFAAWDLAFHMIPMAAVDPQFAKDQLLLMLREWYLHPNGQMPAYEFNFSDVNPPVHAWAVWHVYRMTQGEDGTRDLDFLERAFQKLLLNFTWWVNRHDADGRNLFGGGFLGLDNIGVFDRSRLPEGVSLDQADATAWMGLYCSCMLQMSIELAQTRPTFEDIASKFLTHYVAVIDALNSIDGDGLWNDEEGFYFDRMRSSGSEPVVMKVRSIVGLVPLFAICVLQQNLASKLPSFKKRAEWFRRSNPQLERLITETETEDPAFRNAFYLALVPKERLLRILSRVLDESEFLSPFGVRSVSKWHEKNPFEMSLNNEAFRVEYYHAESSSNMFGGNSNWRGPIWFPMNALICLALDQYHLVYGDELKVECPTGSGCFMNLQEVSGELNKRLGNIFVADEFGARPCHGGETRYAQDAAWRELLLFSEYFSGDTGRGVGASHQTGWTALIASAILWRGRSSEKRLQLL